MSAPTAASSIGDALAAATDALRAAGVESPRLDAELLLAEATGLDRAALAADPDAALEPGAGRYFAEVVRRRLRREPVAYILGRKGFRRIGLRVDRRVLIPRPETELLVEAAHAIEATRPSPLAVLEIGTGSGAVALAIAEELDARVTATETSAAALAVARANAERLGLADRVRFIEGALPAADDPERDPSGALRYDLIVANLPYVSGGEWERLAPEIREHEPREAVAAGGTGLEAIEEVLAALAPAGVSADAIALEVGEGQAEAVAKLARAAGYRRTEVERDLAGIERVVSGRVVR